jgi:DNA polymerase
VLNFYDFECFPKLWTVTIINPITKEKTVIVNDRNKLLEHYRSHKKEIYVGFNNRQYDDWMFKAILCNFDPWKMNEWLIQKGRKGWEFSNLLKKVELNTFDCMIGFNGLKTLEAFSGMSIQETTIPFDYDGEFTPQMIDEVLFYNEHDVLATIKVFMERKSEFDSYMGLIKLFDLPLSYLGKSKAQLSAIILGAKHTKHNDEFDISLPPTMRIEKYTKVVNYFKNDWDYDTGLETDIAGVPHVYGTGGIHGAIPNYFGEGEFLHVDVNSYYPSLMLRYPEYCMSRSGASVEKFQEIKDNRIVFKKQKDPRANALKIVLNSTYGAMKDTFNPLYDPRSANNVCVFGQLLLTDLIERLEGHCDLIQSNTDGLIIKLHNNEDEVRAICKEWEDRTGMGLGYDRITKVCQKDVNNYLAVFENGKIEAKGAYVKDLNNLDYDLAIVNEAVRGYLLWKISVEDTIYSCQDFRKFQKVVKLSNKYKWVEHESEGKTIRYDNKCYRVFASRNPKDGRILKCDGVRNPAKFGNTPDRCFIVNDDIGRQSTDGFPNLDREWYVNLAKKRLEDFGVC